MAPLEDVSEEDQWVTAHRPSQFCAYPVRTRIMRAWITLRAKAGKTTTTTYTRALIEAPFYTLNRAAAIYEMGALLPQRKKQRVSPQI